jgi:hypothetical protein
MSVRLIDVVDASVDPKDPWPPPPEVAPTAGHAAGQWPAHTKAFEPRGLGDADPAPLLVTVVYRR